MSIAIVGPQEPFAKGHDILFQLLAQPQWNERNLSLNFYGRCAGIHGVKAMALLLGISERFTFVLAYSSLQKVWLNSHVLVMASRYEGLPLALAEAMSLGRPAVVTDVAECAIPLCVGIDGFVAQSPSLTAFAEAMECLWQHRSPLPQEPARIAAAAILSSILDR